MDDKGFFVTAAVDLHPGFAAWLKTLPDEEINKNIRDFIEEYRRHIYSQFQIESNTRGEVVPPHVYVERARRGNTAALRYVTPESPGYKDLILEITAKPDHPFLKWAIPKVSQEWPERQQVLQNLADRGNALAQRELRRPQVPTEGEAPEQVRQRWDFTKREHRQFVIEEMKKKGPEGTPLTQFVSEDWPEYRNLVLFFVKKKDPWGIQRFKPEWAEEMRGIAEKTLLESDDPNVFPKVIPLANLSDPTILENFSKVFSNAVKTKSVDALIKRMDMNVPEQRAALLELYEADATPFKDTYSGNIWEKLSPKFPEVHDYLMNQAKYALRHPDVSEGSETETAILNLDTTNPAGYALILNLSKKGIDPAIRRLDVSSPDGRKITRFWAYRGKTSAIRNLDPTWNETPEILEGVGLNSPPDESGHDAVVEYLKDHPTLPYSKSLLMTFVKQQDSTPALSALNAKDPEVHELLMGIAQDDDSDIQGMAYDLLDKANPKTQAFLVEQVKGGSGYAVKVVDPEWPGAKEALVAAAQIPNRPAFDRLQMTWPGAPEAIVSLAGRVLSGEITSRMEADIVEKLEPHFPGAKPVILKFADDRRQCIDKLDLTWPETIPLILKLAEEHSDDDAWTRVKADWPGARKVILEGAKRHNEKALELLDPTWEEYPEFVAAEIKNGHLSIRKATPQMSGYHDAIMTWLKSGDVKKIDSAILMITDEDVVETRRDDHGNPIETKVLWPAWPPEKYETAVLDLLEAGVQKVQDLLRPEKYPSHKEALLKAANLPVKGTDRHAFHRWDAIHELDENSQEYKKAVLDRLAKGDQFVGGLVDPKWPEFVELAKKWGYKGETAEELVKNLTERLPSHQWPAKWVPYIRKERAQIQAAGFMGDEKGFSYDYQFLPKKQVPYHGTDLQGAPGSNDRDRCWQIDVYASPETRTGIPEPVFRRAMYHAAFDTGGNGRGGRGYLGWVGGTMDPEKKRLYVTISQSDVIQTDFLYSDPDALRALTQKRVETLTEERDALRKAEPPEGGTPEYKAWEEQLAKIKRALDKGKSKLTEIESKQTNSTWGFSPTMRKYRSALGSRMGNWARMFMNSTMDQARRMGYEEVAYVFGEDVRNTEADEDLGELMGRAYNNVLFTKNRQTGEKVPRFQGMKEETVNRKRYRIIPVAPNNQRIASLARNLDRLIFRCIAAEELHDYCSTQIDIPGEIGMALSSWAKQNISPEDLHEDEDDPTSSGVEDDPHVTVLYGLQEDNPLAVGGILMDVKPFPVKLGKTDIFEPEDEDYDVVFITIESPGMVALHKKIADLPHTDTHSEYHPHATLAYVKKGTGKKYKGKDDLEGFEFLADSLSFRGKDETNTELPFGAEVKEAAFSLIGKGPADDPITDAAILWNGKVYKGAHHGMAINEALDDYDKDIDTFVELEDFTQGFVTKSGKFLTREQAYAYAGMSGPPQPLVSEDMNWGLEHRKTAQWMGENPGSTSPGSAGMVSTTSPIQMPGKTDPPSPTDQPKNVEKGWEDFEQAAAFVMKNRRFDFSDGFGSPRFLEVRVGSVVSPKVDARRIDASVTLNWGNDLFLPARVYGTLLDVGKEPEMFCVLQLPDGKEKTYRMDEEGMRTLGSVLDTMREFGHPFNVGGAPMEARTPDVGMQTV